MRGGAERSFSVIVTVLGDSREEDNIQMKMVHDEVGNHDGETMRC